MYRLVLIITLIAGVNVQSQIEYSNWYFGNKAGIRFENDTVISLNDGVYDFIEGVSILSDSEGNLILYSSGDRVINKHHNEMENGDDLNGDETSTQSSLILRHPKLDSLYYIFTISNNGMVEGFQYSIVDMSAASGIGKVTENKNVPIKTPVCEKITAVSNDDNTKIWIIIHEWESDKFYAYPFDEEGFHDEPVVSQSGMTHEGNDGYAGYMKASPRGDMIALVSKGLGKIELSRFDSDNGTVSDSYLLNDDFIQGVYGVEFSPDGTKLYVSSIGSPSQVIQYDLDKLTYSSIKESRTLIKSYDNANLLGSIQLGPDQRIYVSKYKQNYLDVIRNPNKRGTACNYMVDKVHLEQGECNYGLPTFNQSLLYKDDGCQIGSFEYEFFYLGPKLVINGSPVITNKQLILTEADFSSHGTIWYRDKLPLSKGFEIAFSFSTSGGRNNSAYNDNSEPGGDGFAFVIQNSSTAADGRSGWGMGYHGISNALAIEFDLFNNAPEYYEDIFDKNGNHISIQKSHNGQITAYHTPQTTVATALDIVEIKHDKINYSKVSYHPENATLSVYLDTVPDLHEPIFTVHDFDIRNYIDLDNNLDAYIGFTAATGDCYQKHIIHNWSVCLLNETTVSIETNKSIIGPCIYPNPAKDIINITVEEHSNITNIEIYNHQGITVDRITNPQITEKNLKVDCSNLPTGSYYLIIRSISKYSTYSTFPFLIVK